MLRWWIVIGRLIKPWILAELTVNCDWTADQTMDFGIVIGRLIRPLISADRTVNCDWSSDRTTGDCDLVIGFIRLQICSWSKLTKILKRKFLIVVGLRKQKKGAII